MDEILTTEYKFYLDDTDLSKVYTKKVPIGRECEILTSKEIEALKPGWMLKCYTYYNEEDPDAVIPSNIHTDSNQYVTTVKVTQQPESFKVEWQPSDHTNYDLYHYLENLNISEPTLTTENCTLKDTTHALGTTFDNTKAGEHCLSYTGFTPLTPVEKPIAENGETCVDIFYQRNSYTINMNYAGGSNSAGESSSTVSIKYQNNVSIEPPTRDAEQYRFDYWKDPSTGAKVALPETMPDHDIDLEAQWQKYYVVTYLDIDGNVYKNLPVDEYKKAYYHPDEAFSEVNGIYRFGGWYTDSACQNWFDVNSTDITQNITLYPKWFESKDIIFYKNDGTSTSYTYHADSSVPFSLPHYKHLFGSYGAKEGKYFLGWASSADADTHDYLPCDVITDFSSMNTNFYAVYTSDFCTITLCNAWKPSEKVTAKVGKGTVISFWDVEDNKLTCPAGYEKYDQYSYDADSDGTMFYEQINSDMTVYQHWKLTLKAHCDYYNSDGIEVTNDYLYFDGKPLSYPAADDLPQREDYFFQDFFIDSALTTPVNFASVNIPGYGSQSTLHVYVKWSDSTAGVSVYFDQVLPDPGFTLNVDQTTGKITAVISSSSITVQSFVWKIDENLLTGENSVTYTYSAAGLAGGSHSVVCVITDTEGNMYSARTEIKVNGP